MVEHARHSTGTRKLGTNCGSALNYAMALERKNHSLASPSSCFSFFNLKIDGITLDCPGLLIGQRRPGIVDHAQKSCHRMNISWRMNISRSIADTLQPQSTSITPLFKSQVYWLIAMREMPP